MNAREAAKKMDRAARRLVTEMRNAEKANIQTTLRACVRHSSGRNTSKKRKPVMPINIISGELVQAWRSEGPELLGGDMHSMTYNEQYYAGILDDGVTRQPPNGRYMVRRPLVETVVKQVEPKINERRERAIEKALEG